VSIKGGKIMASNYPPGVSGNEPEISGEWTPICVECGDEVQAVDNQGRCVTCISMAHIGLIINKIEGGK
jgi:hypothetical protein